MLDDFVNSLDLAIHLRWFRVGKYFLILKYLQTAFKFEMSNCLTLSMTIVHLVAFLPIGIGPMRSILLFGKSWGYYRIELFVWDSDYWDDPMTFITSSHEL